MLLSGSISRRSFLQSASYSFAGAASRRLWLPAFAEAAMREPLREFGYGDVGITSEPHERQFRDSQEILLNMSEDSLLKPFRQMAGLPAPGEDLGGWYVYDPNYDTKSFDRGFAPTGTFGQWVSALARGYAATGSPAAREKVLRLNRLYAQVITDDFYDKNRFPAYCYDKLTCGLIDSHEYAGDPDAFASLGRTADVALRHLPAKAVEHGTSWRPGKDITWSWDESYTMPENQFLAYQRGAGDRFRAIGIQYLNEPYYDALAEGRNDMAGRHAYSHVNCLCSAMQAYLTLGDEKYFRAASNAFEMLLEQSYATGGWGPDETLRATNSDDLFESLTKTHSSFETPCGAYAHFKLMRYFLRITRDSRYGDSMERVMYNTILGAKPLQPDGRAFYYSDNNFDGSKVYSDHRWPCCSGTYPQIAADYRISAYFRDPRGVYVNLYLPSELRWTEQDSQISLKQSGQYPFDTGVRMDFTLSKPREFTLNVRIPAWAEGASISVNGARLPSKAAPGSFTSVRREWKSGDRVDLELPLTMRLEAVNARHPDVAALLSGPLVLFPVTDSMPKITRTRMLAAKRDASNRWLAETTAGPLLLLPFSAIQDERYTTYVKLS